MVVAEKKQIAPMEPFNPPKLSPRAQMSQSQCFNKSLLRDDELQAEVEGAEESLAKQQNCENATGLGSRLRGGDDSIYRQEENMII